MSGDHVDQKERPVNAGFGAGHASAVPAPLPDRAPIGPASGVASAAPGASWQAAGLRGLLRVLRNAAIAVGLLTLVPVALVAIRRDDLMQVFTWSQRVRERVLLSDRVRFMALPKDQSVTPVVAGRVLASLSSEPRKDRPGGFREMDSRRATAPWDSLKVAPGMFRGAEPTVYGTPHSGILKVATKGQFSSAERAYLRTVALSPIWREVEIVARAPAVDVVGARFRLPLGRDATWEELPIMRSGRWKEIGNASISRAAWFLDRGQRDSAEAAVRTVISFGFALVDNAPTMMDQLQGAAIVGLGREGMRELYTAVGDPAARSRAVAPITAREIPRPPARTSDELRRYIIAHVNDPSAPLAERIESVRALTFSSCTNVRELLLGPSDDVKDAMARARRTIPRFPSERALVELAARMPELRPQDVRSLGPFERVAVSASVAAGAVLRNPRLGTCALLAATTRGSR